MNLNAPFVSESRALPAGDGRSILVLLNPRSGPGILSMGLLSEIERTFGASTPVAYQFSHSAEDGRKKVRHALNRGAGLVLVAGGDGMVNTIGAELVGRVAALGVIPAGSGNGFARHFAVPLQIRRAVRALAAGQVAPIDVGWADGRPFFVTCSMAWDAALTEAFEKYPVRGILPYILAGAERLLDFRSPPIRIEVDGAPAEDVPDPFVFTIANLTQFGGGVRIAPHARADDGELELVVIRRRDAPTVAARIGAVFNGTIDRIPEVTTRRFRRMRVTRVESSPIQIDGEIVPAGPELVVEVRPRALNVLIPATAGEAF